MRDDIHKRVPRPPAVQRWVRLSVNDADREGGRSFDGLQAAAEDTCKREIGKGFVQNLLTALNRPDHLFAPLSDVISPRDLNGRGGPAEAEVITECKRLMASGVSPQAAGAQAIETTMRNRIAADIRVTAATLPQRDRKTPVVLDSMRADAQRLNYRALAESVCNGQIYEARRRVAPAIDLDSDLRGLGGGQ
jgi:hypothetical protein